MSRWLFVGQRAAGFVVYRGLLENGMFIVANGCVPLTAIGGRVLTLRRERAQTTARAGTA